METNTNIFQNTKATSVVITENNAVDPTNPEHIFSLLDATQGHVGEKPISISKLRSYSAFKRVPVGMLVVRVKDGTVLLSNPAMQNLLGYTRQELAGMSFTHFTHPEDAEKEKEAYLKIKSGQCVSFDITKRFIRKDGTYFTAQFASAVIRRSCSKPVVMIGMIMETG